MATWRTQYSACVAAQWQQQVALIGLLLPLLPLLAAGPGSSTFPPSGAAGWRVSARNPVLVPDNATWEHTAVQEPQVIYVPELKLMRMWYRGAGWGFPTGLGVADSPDGGKTWWKYAGNPVWGARGVPGEAGGQPWIYREGPGLYWLYTTYSDAHGGGDSAAVQIAKSSDGLNWTNVSVGAVPLPSAHDARPAADRSVTGTMFGNRAVWKEAEGTWHMLQVRQTLLPRPLAVLPVLTTKGLWRLCAGVRD
jgi:hypothetical protein